MQLFINTTGCDGSDLFWSWLLWPLLAFLLGALLGWLLKNLFAGDNTNNNDRYSSLEADLAACRKENQNLTSSNSTKYSSLEADLAACRREKNNLTSKVASLKLATDAKASSNTNSNVASSFTSNTTTPTVAFNADAAKAAFGKRIKQDDLTVVEGIGPKIQELFHNHDVKTWLALSGCSVEKCKTVLNSGGSRFKMHNPKTWPKQASFAAEGKWEALKKWQDELDGGL